MSYGMAYARFWDHVACRQECRQIFITPFESVGSTALLFPLGPGSTASIVNATHHPKPLQRKERVVVEHADLLPQVRGELLGEVVHATGAVAVVPIICVLVRTQMYEHFTQNSGTKVEFKV